MFRRWFFAPLIALVAVVATAVAACGGSASGGTTNNAKTTQPAATSSPKVVTTTKPAGHSSAADSLLGISKLCLVTMAQVQTLSPVIFNLAPKPSDDRMASGDDCVYGGKDVGGIMSDFLSVTVLTTWGGMPNQVPAKSGFTAASAGVVSVNGTSLVTAGAQITSGAQAGQWLVLTVGNQGQPLVTWEALEVTLGEAESQYAASNARAPSSSPATAGGGTTATNDVACKLIPVSVISSTFPPPDSHGLRAIEMGHGPLKSQVADATDYICGYDFWANNTVNPVGSPDGSVVVTLSCGPGAGKDAQLTDDVYSSTFGSGSATGAVGVTRLGGSSGTGSQTVQGVVDNAAAVAQSINACG